MEGFPTEGTTQNTAAELISQLGERIRQLEVERQTGTGSTTSAPSNEGLVPEPRKKKATLPDPPKFEGIRNAFRAWFREMKNKLEVDGMAIGSTQDRFAYIYSRLGKLPQNMTVAFVEKGGPDGAYDPDQYLEYLYGCYGDPNAQARAIDRLRDLKQRENESFATFLPKFEKELADSGGGNWHDTVQVNYLEGALNKRLKAALVYLPNPPTLYSDFVRILQQMGSKMDGLDASTRRYGTARDSAWQGSRKTTITAATENSPDQMDWEPSDHPRITVQMAKPSLGKAVRARWVSPEEISKRLRENRCFRCGDSTHKKVVCPYLPARNPATKVNQHMVQHGPELEEDNLDPDQQTEDSEKE